MPSADKTLKDFEKSLNKLEQIVEKMENDELGLDESLKQFESGIQLARECQTALTNAELKVNQLIEENGLQQTIPFDQDDD